MSTVVPAPESPAVGVLRRRLSRVGLNIVLPLPAERFDAVCVPLGGPSIGTLLEGAGGAIIVGDGGGAFFAAFQGVWGPDSPADPLDEHTRAVMGAAVYDVLGPAGLNVSFRTFFPFAAAAPTLPFQRLGLAAGLPEAGPLGLQIHPTYGPWWAYRALVLVAAPIGAEPPLATPCDDCSRPCENACPAGAVRTAGFAVGSCVAHRLVDSNCHSSCAARSTCPEGGPHRYPAPQLGFHMKDSLARIRLTARSS